MCPITFGVLIGFLLLDEKDDDTLTALQVTPLSTNGYVAYRVAVPIALTIPLMFVIFPLANLSVFNGFSVGGTNQIAWTDNGERNYYWNCHLFGMADTASAQNAGSRSLKIGTGIEAGFQTYDQPNTSKERPAGATTQAALKWLAQRDNTPYYLWVHYFDPHSEYAAPPPYNKMYDREGEAVDKLFKQKNAWRKLKRTGEEIPFARSGAARYAGEVTYMDKHIGRLIDYLKQQEI